MWEIGEYPGDYAQALTGLIKKLLPILVGCTEIHSGCLPYGKYLSMRWVMEETGISGLIEFRMVRDQESCIVIRYHPQQHSVRISLDPTRKLFFLHQRGLLRSTTVFTNEYGLEVGKLAPDLWQTKGFILEIEGQRYHIAILHEGGNALVVFQKKISQPLIVCGLAPNISLPDRAGDLDESFTSLLLGLCWFLYIPRKAGETLSLSTA